MPVQYTDEILNTTTGLFARRAKLQDSVANIGMRGLFGGSYNLVMIDGQPLNDGYNNGVQWPHISKDNIERIEVVRGPFSSLYGQNALGGVVNVITRSPKKREMEASASYGSYDTKAAHVRYDDVYTFNGGLIESIGLSISGEMKKSDGYRNQLVMTTAKSGTGTIPVTGWEQTTDRRGNTQYLIGDVGENTWFQQRAGGRFYINFSSDTNLFLTYSFSRWGYGYDGGRSYLRDASGNEVTSGKVQIDNGASYNATISPYSFAAGSSEDTRHMSYAKFTTKFGDAILTASVGYNKCDTWYTTPKSGSTPDGGTGTKNSTNPKDNILSELQIDIPFTLPMLTKSWLTVGATHRWDRAKGSEWYIQDWSDADSGHIVQQSAMSGQQRFESVFSQIELGLHRTLKVYGGVRYDYWVNYDGSSLYNTVNGTTFAITAVDERDYATTSAYQLSPRASIVFSPEFSIGEIWTFRSIWASYGRGFNAPTLYQLYKTWVSSGVTYNSNPDLDPQRSSSWEVGIEQLFGADHIRLSTTYFRSTIENLIYNMTIDSTTKKYMNAGEGRVSGLEAEMRIRLFMFELFGNYTYTDSEITENNADSTSVGKRFQMAPRNMYNIGLYARTRYVAGSVSWRYVSKMYGDSDNSDTVSGVYGSYDPVRLLDARLNIYPYEWCSISVSCNNILDREYYVYYKAQGRTFNVEVEMRL